MVIESLRRVYQRSSPPSTKRTLAIPAASCTTVASPDKACPSAPVQKTRSCRPTSLCTGGARGAPAPKILPAPYVCATSEPTRDQREGWGGVRWGGVGNAKAESLRLPIGSRGGT